MAFLTIYGHRENLFIRSNEILFFLANAFSFS